MLVLEREEGEWTEIRHRSGDTIRVRVQAITPGCPGRLDLVFDDRPRNFRVERPERARPSP